MSAIFKEMMTRTVKSGVRTKTYKVQMDPAPTAAGMRKMIAEFKEEQQVPPGNPIAERHEVLAIQAALQRDGKALEKHLVQLAKPRKAPTPGPPGHNQQQQQQQQTVHDLSAAREKRLRECFALCFLDPDERLKEMKTLGEDWKKLSSTRRDRRLDSYLAALRKRRAWHLLTEVVMLDLRMCLLVAKVRRSLAATPARTTQQQQRKGGQPAQAAAAVMAAAVADVEARWVVGKGPARRKGKEKKSHLEPVKLLRILAEGYVVAADRTPILTGTTTNTTTQPSGSTSSNPSSSSPGQAADGGGKENGGGTKAKAKDENSYDETTTVVEQEERLLPFWQLPVYSDERYRPYAKVAALALWRERLVMQFRVEHQQTQMDVFKEYYELVLEKCKRRANGSPGPAERPVDHTSKKKPSKGQQTSAVKMRELYERTYASKDRPMLRGR